ncbi:MAG: hypothetical protein KatS3mg078_0698 [Deltaproteobacteria bacterium]|jgi:hypothetical protein|nr:MAG: hypothetical protein KatS3mg078_0698 [Deltaproteobacteria bacterium]
MPIVFLHCECGCSIHVYVSKERFFRLEINPLSWQEEYSEKVRSEKIEEAKRFAKRLGAVFIDSGDSDNISCPKCERVYSVFDLKK